MNLLSVADLSLSYANKLIFEPVSFQVAAGDCLRIDGENGAGKSTLLRALAGLKKISSGNIFCHEKSILIGHALGLTESFSVEEMLQFYSGLYRNESSLAKVLTVCDLEALKRTRIMHCSRGQQQRIAIARLLLSDAKLWLLDEVLTGLDQNYQQWLFELMTGHLAKQGSIVLVSHNQMLPSWMKQTVRLTCAH